MQGRHQRLRGTLFLAVAVVFTVLALIGYATDALKNLELDSVDARFSVRGEREAPKDLIFVKIDDDTFSDLDRRWPFPRSIHGRAIDTIAADKPKAIAYDVQFTEKSARLEQDIALLESVLNANGRVVLATTEVNERGQHKILGGDRNLRDVDARAGNANLPPDPGGVNRRVPHTLEKLESLAVGGTEVATGRQVKPDRFADDGTAWIDYVGPPGTIRSVSFSRAAEGKTPRGLFRDKVVVVGPEAGNLQDVHPTSTTGEELMAGGEIQANAIDTVRRGLPLQSTPGALDVLLIVLFGIAAPLVSLRVSALRALLIAAALGVVFTVAAQLAFNSGRVVSFVYPLAALVLSSVGALAVHYVTTAFERERVRDMFSRFVPENVVDDVLARADGLRLGGVQREGTVMFTDLRGFTSFAESLPPDRVIGLLNVYLTEMSEAILDHGGTIVAYMGDGIMAVYGAPIEQPDHADRALATAREMLDRRLPRFNEVLREEGLSEDGFRMGIGLNSGNVMSGNVGSERRLEYTAIGDTTNTAARLEGMTKGTPHQLFVAESTRTMLRDQPDDLIYVGEFEVRGRQAKIQLWSLAEGELSEGAEPAGAQAERPS